MHARYGDILRRIKQAPLWWDENGVPRFDPFHPRDCADFYASEAVLLGIACQECGAEFDVALTSQRGSDALRATGILSLRELIEERQLHYGDPPRHSDDRRCSAGDSTNSIPKQIKSFWFKDFREALAAMSEGGGVEKAGFDPWFRDPALEGAYERRGR